MTLTEFISLHDKENSVVLLEGKRNVRDEDKSKLTQLGKLLASKTKNIIFRSGNATGADQFFSLGVASVSYERLQVITPYTDHRKKTNVAYSTISLDDIDIAAEQDVVLQSKLNKKTETLIDKYVAGQKNQVTIKAAYILRDTVKVLGTEKISPARFGIFYDDLENPGTGGTGHTMNVCKQNGVDLIDQNVWFHWLQKIL
ncbi:MAG: hypothetical protein IPP29_07775 [Bacteroidetes bacterium]|nr:hypothetical protein [Bacteroidota bacterium]